MILMLVRFHIIPYILKKVSNVVSKEAVKNAQFDTLNTKVNNLEKKILVAITLVHINQYNTAQIFKVRRKNIDDIDKKYLTLVVQ